MARTAFATDTGSTSTDVPSFTIRSGGVALEAGELVIGLLGYDGAVTISDYDGFTSLKAEGFTGAIAHIVYKIAAGGETTWDPIMSAAERGAIIFYHWPVADWHGTSIPEVAARATGSSTQPDPPALTPSWGTDGGVITSYLAACFADDSAAPFPITGWPTDFSLLQTESGGDAQTSSCDVAAAMYEASVASKDPAVFTMTSTETWAAYTLAVRGPAAAGAVRRRRLTLLGVS